MTTREEYAEAAEQMDAIVTICKVYGLKEQSCLLAARVLRALADGAVLCRKGSYPHADGERSVAYYPIEEQP